MKPSEIDRRFGFHAPGDTGKGEQHDRARAVVKDTARVLNELVPEGREKSLAITKLEEVLFWANAGIARPPSE